MDYEGLGETKAMGFVTHVINIHETGSIGYETLFNTLSDAGITTQRVMDAATQFPFTSTEPGSAAAEHQCGADEGLDKDAR